MDKKEIILKYKKTIVIQKYFHIVLGVFMGLGTIYNFYLLIPIPLILWKLRSLEKKVSEPFEENMDIDIEGYQEFISWKDWYIAEEIFNPSFF